MCAVSTQNAPYHRIRGDLQNGWCWTGEERSSGAGRLWHDVAVYKGYDDILILLSLLICSLIYLGGGIDARYSSAADSENEALQV